MSVTREQLAEMEAHALAEYPYECCGIVIGKPGSTADDRLFRCTNIQNRLHGLDPQVHPRDARTAFQIEGKELIRIHREAQDNGLSIKLFYHSHPDHDAYFSDEDRRMALFGEDPTYPEARYLVISVYNKKIKEHALFEWNPADRAFERVELKPS